MSTVRKGSLDGHDAGMRRPMSGQQEINDRIRIGRILLSPIKYSGIYLVGTFLLFLVGPLSSEVTNFLELTFFISFTYGGLFLGYYLGIYKYLVQSVSISSAHYGQRKMHKIILMLGIAYFFIWGINMIIEFGGSSLSDVLRTITAPGEAYKAKFDVFEEQLATNRTNRITQILIILSILYGLFVPLTAASWSRLHPLMKYSCVIAITVYVSSFLYIGTMKGIGDIVLFLVSGIGVGYARRIAIQRHVVDSRPQRKIPIKTLTAVLVCFTFIYMVANQIQRANSFEMSGSRITGEFRNTVISSLLGDSIAYGVYTTLAYPTHGYLGLSYNLDMPFVFSYGAGISQAYESYRIQYLGGESNLRHTYPHRTEAVSDWSATMFWSTIFPWLASDMTFYVVPFFMMFIGYFFAVSWVSCIRRPSLISLATFTQLIVMIVYTPANNQVLMNRQGLWVVATLICLYLFKIVARGALK